MTVHDEYRPDLLGNATLTNHEHLMRMFVTVNNYINMKDHKNAGNV